MAFEFLEYDDKPFVFDRDTWALYRMYGPHKSDWVKIEDSDRCVKIQFESWVISEIEAKALARDLARERQEG